MTYTCAECNGTFEYGRTDEEANAEAKEFWGVDNASTNPHMDIVCEECFQSMMKQQDAAYFKSAHWQETAQWVLDVMTGKIKIDGAGHSEKPEAFYDLLRSIYPTDEPMVDIYNRRNIAGFDGWGMESPHQNPSSDTVVE